MPRTQTLTGRYQWTHQLREPRTSIIGESTLQDHKQQNLGADLDAYCSATRMVGEFRYGLGVRSTNVNIAPATTRRSSALPARPLSARERSIGNAGNFPINRDQTDHQFVYNLTAQLFKNHSVRAGTDIRRQALDDLADNFSRGFWTFSDVCAAVPRTRRRTRRFSTAASTRFQKGYGPFFLENRMNEANVYLQDDWRIRDTLTLNLGLRYEYVDAPTEKEGPDRLHLRGRQEQRRAADRLRLRAHSGRTDSSGKLSGGPGEFAFHAGCGIYDGRIFQSVFSQGGANVRFNPPNALDRTVTNQLNVSDPSIGFVFTPGVQTARAAIALPNENLEMPSTTKWNLSIERMMPWNSTLKITYQGNHNDKRLKYSLGNLPLSPLDGPVTVVESSVQRTRGGLPGPPRQGDQRDCR